MKKNIKKASSILGLFVVAMMIFGVTANAYIDPSVMTYVIQIAAGVVVAVGAVAGVYIRKAKKKLNEKLGIDENKNKEVENDEIVADIDED